jgi:ArsR family transcriptional regulator, virulence genes transcriptional regulator
MKNINYNLIASTLRAAGHPVRVHLLELLDSHGEVSVNDICAKIKTPQSLTSHHLNVLTEAGYIKGTRKGKYIFYSIASRGLFEMLQVTKKYLAA